MAHRIGLRPMSFVACSVALAGSLAVARAQSSVGGFDPGANGIVTSVAVQPGGKIVVGGWFTRLGGGGSGTTPRSRIGRLKADGSLDTSLNPDANDVVTAVAVQPDGKVVVGGWFTKLGGAARNYVGRLNADDSLDATFNPGANFEVHALAVQPDGKILVGGNFTMLSGGGFGTTARAFIGRLNAAGSLDTSFNRGANDAVRVLAVQPDGKIVVGGAFTILGGATRNGIGRLNTDGSLDAGFNPGASNAVYAVAVQADGKIVVGGDFTQLGGATRNFIGRLNADGSLDAGFNPDANDAVRSVAVLPDGKVVVGGDFTRLGGATRNFIGRLNADGSLDASSNPGANGPAYAMVVQPDGKITVGGNFSMLGGGGTGTTPRNRIGRFNADGSLDAGFRPGVNDPVSAVVVRPEGKILVSVAPRR